MVGFRQMTWREALLERLIPARRREREAKLKEGIKYLMDHPEAPTIFGGEYIPDGFGGPEGRGLASCFGLGGREEGE